MGEFIILLIVALAVLAFSGFEWAGSCLGDLLKFLLVIGGGIAVTVGAFGVNPILGIVVGYFVLRWWKSFE